MIHSLQIQLFVSDLWLNITKPQMFSKNTSIPILHTGISLPTIINQHILIVVTYKASFWLSGIAYVFNMGPQWQIYFIQSVLLGLQWRVLEDSMELATCNMAPRCLGRAWRRLYVTRNNIALKLSRRMGLHLVF